MKSVFAPAFRVLLAQTVCAVWGGGAALETVCVGRKTGERSRQTKRRGGLLTIRDGSHRHQRKKTGIDPIVFDSKRKQWCHFGAFHIGDRYRYTYILHSSEPRLREVGQLQDRCRKKKSSLSNEKYGYPNIGRINRSIVPQKHQWPAQHNSISHIDK